MGIDDSYRCHQSDCDPKAGITDGDTGRGTEVERLNPVREDQQMGIETQTTPAEEEKERDKEIKRWLETRCGCGGGDRRRGKRRGRRGR